ncbi:unnamed protein product [Nippostrongylus brasiliensis]|uniref:Rho-GAP domain-containing protein n=1 Tax=Nippostrongylus brasiliensis TaxID=27835 RepID=A0A0N4Y3B1_NIPBR|nr:unnamed protein product [Nippostrongylus brasiliensis]
MSSASYVFKQRLLEIAIIKKRSFLQATVCPTWYGLSETEDENMVYSVDIVLPVSIEDDGRRGTTKVKLEKVPLFLVNAFNFINKHGLDCEGLFRREGNASRLNQNNFSVYLGSADIPSNFTIHDVCTMVKRFFRDLKEPLLPSGGLRKALLDLARRCTDNQVTRREFCSVFEPDYEATRRNYYCSLNLAHIGTLGYLMRQLQGIARHASRHQMDASNLATVFAPTLFREDKERAKRKERRGSQEDLLTTVRGDTKLQISAVTLLITHADWIGVSTNCYMTSGQHHRSNSAVPSPRQPFMQSIANLKDPTPPSERKSSHGGNGHACPPPLVDRKASLKTERTTSKSSSGRRSSSAFRGIIHGIGGRLLRRSPSQDRQRRDSMKTERRASSPAVVVSTERVNGEWARASLQRRPSPRYLLFADTSPRRSSPENTQGHTTRSREALPPGPRPSRSRQGTSSTAAKTHSHHSSSQVLRDNPVSMLGEEHFNPSYREHHERSRRRHTTPVKTSTALRRNQPNTRHSGLQLPKRRATVMNARDQEKENLHSGTVSESNSCEDVGESSAVEYATESAIDILSQKGHESRMRRARRNQRRELSSILQDSTFETSTFHDAEKKEHDLDRVRKVSVGCSPIIFPSVAGDSKRLGSAIVGETVVVTPAALSFSGDEEKLPTDIPLTPPPPISSAPPEPFYSKPKDSPTKTVVSRQIISKRTQPPSSPPRSGEGAGDQPSEIPAPSMSSSFNEAKLMAPTKTLRSNSYNEGSECLPTSMSLDEAFVESKEMKDLILNSESEEDMERNFDRRLHFRPSVAFLQNQGIVRERVNHFRQLGNTMSVPLEPISGRSSGLSSRSSLGTGSLMGDEEFVKPTAPPVTHSLNMGGVRRNSAAAFSNVQLSSSPSK